MFTVCLVNEAAMYHNSMAEIFPGCAVLGKLTVIFCRQEESEIKTTFFKLSFLLC